MPYNDIRNCWWCIDTAEKGLTLLEWHKHSCLRIYEWNCWMSDLKRTLWATALENLKGLKSSIVCVFPTNYAICDNHKNLWVLRKDLPVKKEDADNQNYGTQSEKVLHTKWSDKIT